MSKYVSDRQLAERFSVSRATIWRWTRAGRFPTPSRFNGVTRWPLDAVEEFERQQAGGG